MTATAPKPLTLTAARRAAEKADEIANRRRGELVAAVAGRRREIPKPIRDALESFEKADDAANFAREQIAIARADTLTPDERAQRRHFAQVSALVAVYVLGREVVLQDSPLYPWKLRAEGGKLREVPNYAGDMAAATNAELSIKTDDARRRYGECLERIAGRDPYRLACMGSYGRACAMLAAIDVTVDMEPPTVDT